MYRDSAQTTCLSYVHYILCATSVLGERLPKGARVSITCPSKIGPDKILDLDGLERVYYTERKIFKLEQIIANLRESEVLLNRGDTVREASLRFDGS